MKKILVTTIIILSFLHFLNAQEISPWLFGQNHWMEQNDERNRPGYLSMLWPQVQESGIKIVRIGGNGYNRRFPARERLTAMIDSIHGIGAEPILQVPEDFSAEQTIELVNFFNNSSRRRIEFWSIGNEPICNEEDKIDEVSEYLVRIATAIKVADPTAKVFVFDACTFYVEAHAALCGGRLDITGKDKNGNWLIDGFAFHNYPNGAEYEREDVVFSGPFKIAQQARQLGEMMRKANEKHGRTGEAELIWGLTEVNVTYINPDREISGIGNPSFLGGQFMAEMYGIGMQYGAFTVAPWCISETDRVRTDFGYLGLPSEFYPRSSYYHTQMMALNMKGTFLPTESSNSYVRTIASESNDEICIMILNRDEHHDFDFDLFLKKDGFSGKSLTIHADMDLDIVIEGIIPNQTTMMFVLSKSGEILRQYTYGLEHNLKNLPPEVK